MKNSQQGRQAVKKGEGETRAARQNFETHLHMLSLSVLAAEIGMFGVKVSVASARICFAIAMRQREGVLHWAESIEHSDIASSSKDKFSERAL